MVFHIAVLRRLLSGCNANVSEASAILITAASVRLSQHKGCAGIASDPVVDARPLGVRRAALPIPKVLLV